MRIVNETKLARAAVLLAVATGMSSATAPLSSACPVRNSLYGFVGPTVPPVRSDTGSAAKKSEGATNAPITRGSATKGTMGESPLARRLYLRRAERARPKPRFESTAAAGTHQRQQQGLMEEARDVGNIFRMEVAQRLKEMKLMTQQGLGPLAPVAGRLPGPEALSADPLLDPGMTKALERQIALQTKRIKSIADYLQTTPTDEVSRKGLVILVKSRRALLETLRQRDNERWLATTESLGLRQRPDGGVASAEQTVVDARRARRRDRGRRRRRERN